MQSMSAFVAQNYGAGRMDREKKALHYGALVSFAIGVCMFFLTFFHGDVMAGIFSSDRKVVLAAVDYLKAYAIDCLFTSIFFCYVSSVVQLVLCVGFMVVLTRKNNNKVCVK